MDNQQLLMRNLNEFIGLTKGVVTITGFDSTEFQKKNLKDVIANCKCSICGSSFQVKLNSLRRSEIFYEHNCPACKEAYRKQQIEKRLQGRQKGVLKFVEFDHFDGTRAFVKCQCSRCGKFTVVRDDRFSKTQNPLSCENCYPNYTSEKNKLRYQKMHNLFGEEYELDKKIRAKVQSLKQGAEDRNFEFQLSDEEAKQLVAGTCHYCGSSEFIGIDRLDSLQGYTKENCVSCCKYCNLMKNNLPYDLFITQIQKIHKNLISNSTTIETTS